MQLIPQLLSKVTCVIEKQNMFAASPGLTCLFTGSQETKPQRIDKQDEAPFAILLELEDGAILRSTEKWHRVCGFGYRSFKPRYLFI